MDNFNKDYAEICSLGLLTSVFIFSSTPEMASLASFRASISLCLNAEKKQELFLLSYAFQWRLSRKKLPALVVCINDVVFTHEVKQRIICD